MKKTYKGVRPKQGELIMAFHDYELWLIKIEKNWTKLKLISLKSRLKSNWELSWSGERFAEGKDYKKLVHHEPLLCEVVNKIATEKNYVLRACA